MICHVASWPEPINHDISFELVKAGRERYRNKEEPFQSMIRVIKVGDKTVRRFWDHGWYIQKSIQDYIASVASYFYRKMIVHLFPNLSTLSGI